MSKRTSAALCFTVLLVSSLSVTAQVRRRVVVARPHEEPCWQVAGISKSAMDERQMIARQTRAEVEAVCADGSLTPQQRQQRIREIHQQAKQKSEGLITPQQQEALQACQKQRAANHPPTFGGVHRAGGNGPCGEQLSGPKQPAPAGGGGSHEPPEEEIPPQ
jgi:fructose-1-phosphate kinase PfkB-like protein